jgi:hypothetical protein
VAFEFRNQKLCDHQRNTTTNPEPYSDGNAVSLGNHKKITIDSKAAVATSAQLLNTVTVPVETEFLRSKIKRQPSNETALNCAINRGEKIVRAHFQQNFLNR